MKQLSVMIGRQRISYLENSVDPGRPTVLFVHGNSSSARTWLPVVSGDFGLRFHCLALDLPGHGQSAPAADVADYSLPGHAAVLAGFVRELGLDDAVVVGWSPGGQVVLEAVPALPAARGFVIFGAPPIASPAQLAQAFLPNPAMGALFSAQVSESEARALAESFVAPGSPVDVGEFAAGFAATDAAARAGLGASAGQGRFSDELAIVSALDRPLAVVHGAGDQLVSLDHLRKLDIPALWRGEVQVIPGAGHAPHHETPQRFAALLTRFIADLDRAR